MIPLHLQHDANTVWVEPEAVQAVSTWNGGSRVWLSGGVQLHFMETPDEVRAALASANRLYVLQPETKDASGE